MQPSSRLEVIDQFRGFAMMMMVLANYSERIESIPRWLGHTPDIGLTVIDLGAPVFIFAIGLTYCLSVQRRIGRDGWGKTVEHFLRRYMALFGIGALLAYGQELVGESQAGISWDVLQSIAIAGFLTLPFIRLPSAYRVGVGLVLLAVYQLLLDHWWLEEVVNSSHGGLLGSVGWAAMLVLATVFADLFHDVQLRKFFPWLVLLTLVLGIGLALFVPVSKIRISASYILISLGTSGLLFWIFHQLVDNLDFRVPLFATWGRNPLLLYLLHNLLLAVLVLPGIPGWYPQAPSWLVLMQMAGLLGVMSWIGWQLNRRDWRLSL